MREARQGRGGGSRNSIRFVCQQMLLFFIATFPKLLFLHISEMHEMRDEDESSVSSFIRCNQQRERLHFLSFFPVILVILVFPVMVKYDVTWLLSSQSPQREQRHRVLHFEKGG